MKLTTYAVAYSAFVDIYLAVYPAIVLFQLQLKLKKKIALSIALGIGCVYVWIPHVPLKMPPWTRSTDKDPAPVLSPYIKRLEFPKASPALTSHVGLFSPRHI